MPPLDDLSRWARSDGLQIVLLVLGSVLLARLVHWLAQRFASRIGITRDENRPLAVAEQAKHRAAVAEAAERTTVGLLYFIVALMILRRLGVPITTLVAPATVAGVAIGFGAQRVVQDLLSGFFIVSENQYGLGDVVQLAQAGQTTGVVGTVESVTLRTTRLRTLTGELVIIPNGEVRQVTNRSRDWSMVLVDAPIPLDGDIEGATEALETAADAMADDATFGPMLLDRPTVTGVESIQLGYVQIRIAARSMPTDAVAVGRELRRRAALELARAGHAAGPVAFATTATTPPPNPPRRRRTRSTTDAEQPPTRKPT